MINDKNNRLLSQIAKLAFAAFISAGLSTTSFALSTDRDQPADIDADDVEINFKTGERIFKGNVQVIQGTLRIKADKIVAIYEAGELTEATAYGSPAKFRQRPDGKEHDVEGEGQTIFVDETNNTLTLKKNATLKQGYDTARGKEIFYDMANDTLKVKGGADIGSGKKKATAKKQKDDAFFKEKPVVSNDESSETSAAVDAGITPVETTQRSNELPEKLVLPKKKATTSNGRSRLIIVPK